MLTVLVIWLFCSSILGAAHAEDALPNNVQVQSTVSLKEVGSDTFRKYGFSVYRATLWAAHETWNPQKPYALELHYMRSVSKETMVDVLMDNIRDQAVADDVTLARWKQKLIEIMPDVVDGDELIGLYIPNVKAMIFYNGKQIASTTDPVPSQAFFNVWLGEKADEDMRDKLLHHE